MKKREGEGKRKKAKKKEGRKRIEKEEIKGEKEGERRRKKARKNGRKEGRKEGQSEEIKISQDWNWSLTPPLLMVTNFASKQEKLWMLEGGENNFQRVPSHPVPPFSITRAKNWFHLGLEVVR
ncbi:hypothetical protein L345_10176, partial [Ophiophagus hannah]